MKIVKQKHDFSILLKLNINRKKAIWRWFKSKYISKSGYAQKYEGVTKKEITEKIQIIDSIENNENNISIKKLRINTFHLSLRNN